MTALVLAFLFFAADVIVHALYCRRQKRGELYAKFFIILSLMSFVLLAYFLSGISSDYKWCSILIFVLLVPVYLIFYVSTVLLSPSKKILQILESVPDADYELILSGLEKEDLISLRLKELADSGCVFVCEGRYQLTFAGQQTARVLKFCERMIGRPIGG
jgi:hypothetical protein